MYVTICYLVTSANPHDCCSNSQELLRAGVVCWVVHPAYGVKPIAEGIAGNAPPPRRTDGGICSSLMLELCEGGKQMVKVTFVYMKNTPVMYPEMCDGSRLIDDYVSPPAPSDTFVPWGTQYLVRKLEEY